MVHSLAHFCLFVGALLFIRWHTFKLDKTLYLHYLLLVFASQYRPRQRVYEKAAGRVVVVSSGTGLDKTPAEQAAHIRRIAEVSDAVVVGTSENKEPSIIALVSDAH